jgi:hypothetical protein
MIDPLAHFDWGTLHSRYDAMGKRGFNNSSRHLDGVEPRPSSDRVLYYHLLKAAQAHRLGTGRFSLPQYEAVLYWKLFSNHQAMGNMGRWLPPDMHARKVMGTSVDSLVQTLPRELPRDSGRIVALVKSLSLFKVLGIKSDTAIPTRTTLLHFFYPDVVPIFDKMVLQAVGVSDKGANQDIAVFKEYLPFAWSLAERYAAPLDGFDEETPVRLVDMALWVTRNSGHMAGLSCTS